MKIVISTAIIIFGIILILWSVWKLVEQKKFADTAISASGTIVGYEYSDGSRQQLSQDTSSGFAGRLDVSQASPIVEYTTQDGESISFVSSTTIDLSSSEKVPLLYLPTDLQNAQIDDFFSLWGWIYILSGFGAIISIVGVALRFLL